MEWRLLFKFESCNEWPSISQLIIQSGKSSVRKFNSTHSFIDNIQFKHSYYLFCFTCSIHFISIYRQTDTLIYFRVKTFYPRVKSTLVGRGPEPVLKIN